MRTFEDFTVGQVLAHAPWTVTAEDIVAFARDFDPQPFHIDPNSLEAAMTGGLIASGWHVAAIFMRTLADAFLVDSTSMGSPGVDTLKWLKPVRPGDTLTARSTVLEVRPSQSRPDRGMVRFRHEVTNQNGETVMTLDNPVLFGRRAAP
jgi:acyl dehydratase